MPRLLLCSFDVLPGPTGSSRRLTEYLRGLADHFNVVVLSVKTPDHSHIEKFHGARLLRVPVGTGDLLSRLQTFDRAVRRQLESEEYAVVHFTDPFCGYALCELRERYGYKLLYEAHAFPSQELRFTNPELEGDRRFLARVRREELFCLMNADRVITGSDVTRGFISGLGVPKEAIEVLPSPVDLEPFATEATGAPHGDPMRAIYLGSQVAWQGLPTLLRAMAVATSQVDVRLAIVGPSHPTSKALLEGLVLEQKLADRVDFRPPVPHGELHPILAAADVGVVPLEDVDRNRVQGGPLSKAAEYLAAGLPVVASDLPLTRGLLPEAATRFHVPGDAEDLGRRLVELAKDRSLRLELAGAARAHAQRVHDSAAIRARLRTLYLELAGLPASEVRRDQEQGPAPTMIGTPTGRIPPPLPRAAQSERVTDPDLTPPGIAPKVVRESGVLGEDAPRTAPEREPRMIRPPPLPASPPRAHAPPEVHPDEVVAVAEDEAEEISGDDVVEAEASAESEPGELETADDAVVDAEPEDELPAPLPSDPQPQPVSRLEAWFAQLVHGYCPPDGAQFARPTPSTNFPGRDGTSTATVQPQSAGQQSFPTGSDGG